MTPLEREAQERTTFVAALRELADALETDASLPVPFAVSCQAGFYATVEDGVARQLTGPEKRAALRTFATTLGVDVVEDSTGNRKAEKHVGPIRYFVQVNADEARHRTPSPRVVSADEDAALIGATAVAS